MGMIAERRLNKGLKLNYPESIAYITSHALEGAREGKTVEEVMHDASNLLSTEQVMDGVADMITLLQVEAVFTDGSRLVSIHHPIKPAAEQDHTPAAVELAEGKKINVDN